MMTNRYQNLERRRQLELQGYRTDIATLKKKLKEVEKQLQKVTLGSTEAVDALGLRGDADIAILKQVKSSTLKTTQLMNELKNLKLMMYRIEDDMRKI
ncbi:unnamed protein product [Dicrocoelium dendriticum]|nr:unnamed protein product [Dicrocoelium dendriticum]